MTTTEAVRALFKHGVERIKDEAVRDAVCGVLWNVVPTQFWSAPASSSGRYHAPWQNEEGGLVRHTVEMLVLLPRAASMYAHLDEQPHLDLLRAAVILHDCLKGGRPWVNATVPNHAALAADAWSQVSGVCGVPDVSRDIVHEAVLFHEGRWSRPNPWPGDVRPHTRVVHMLDLIDSAGELSLLFEPKRVA